MSYSTPQPLNNRLDFLKDTPKKNYTSYRSSYHTERTPQYNKNTFDRSKSTKPCISLPTHSEGRKKLQPVALNDRFHHLKSDNTRHPKRSRFATNVNVMFIGGTKTPKKITFVAFPSRKQWELGYRPAWILRSNADPPENYDVAYNIYKEYIEKDEINIPRTKFVGDKAKEISTTYLNKLNQKK